MSRRAFWWWFGVILVVAGILRFYKLGQVPVSIYWDEIAMLVDAKSVAQSGLDMHGRPWFQLLYPSYGDYKLPVYIWLASATVKLFGVSEWALRLPSVIAGLVTVISSGVIAKFFVSTPHLHLKTHDSTNSTSAFSDIAQLSTMMVVAVSPWSIMFSRTGFEGHVAQSLVALSVVAMLLSGKRKWWLGLAVALGSLATYTYFSVRFVWPVVLVAVQLWQLSRVSHSSFKKMILTSLMTTVVPLVVFAGLLWPMTHSPLYEASNRFRLSTDSILKTEPQIIQSNVYREIAGNTVIDRLVFHRWLLTGRELAKNYADHLSLDFLFVSGDNNLRHGTHEFGLFLFIFLPVWLGGLVVMANRYPGVLAVLGLWWLSALLPASVPQDTPHALRSLNALVPLSIMIGIGLARWCEWLWRHLDDSQNSGQLMRWWGVTLASGLMVAISVLSFWYHYFLIYPIDSAWNWQQGYRETAVAITELKQDYPVYFDSFDDRFYLWPMAYGPYTAADFHSWQSHEYQFTTFDKIVFGYFHEGKKVDAGQTMVIVGTAERIAVLKETYQFQTITERVIADPTGQPKLIVAVVKK